MKRVKYALQHEVWEMDPNEYVTRFIEAVENIFHLLLYKFLVLPQDFLYCHNMAYTYRESYTDACLARPETDIYIQARIRVCLHIEKMMKSKLCP
jgi:hypothetical protein